MGLDVCDVGVLGSLLSLTSHVQQDIETRKIRVLVNDRLRLLFLNLYQLMDGGQQLLPEPVSALAGRDVRKARTILAAFLRHIFNFGIIGAIPSTTFAESNRLASVIANPYPRRWGGAEGPRAGYVWRRPGLPAQQSPLGCPARFQAGVGLLLFLVCHNLLTGIAAFPDARFRGENGTATPARFRDRFIERKDARFLGQEVRIMKFAVTHTKQPPSSRRRAACVANVLVPPGVSDSPFSYLFVKPTIVLFSRARWQPKKIALPR
jgi:hypothetical protein